MSLGKGLGGLCSLVVLRAAGNALSEVLIIHPRACAHGKLKDARLKARACPQGRSGALTPRPAPPGGISAPRPAPPGAPGAGLSPGRHGLRPGHDPRFTRLTYFAQVSSEDWSGTLENRVSAPRLCRIACRRAVPRTLRACAHTRAASARDAARDAMYLCICVLGIVDQIQSLINQSC